MTSWSSIRCRSSAAIKHSDRVQVGVNITSTGTCKSVDLFTDSSAAVSSRTSPQSVLRPQASRHSKQHHRGKGPPGDNQFTNVENNNNSSAGRSAQPAEQHQGFQHLQGSSVRCLGLGSRTALATCWTPGTTSYHLFIQRSAVAT
uniref:(northern house mosquito) hypothetical protein n=1 Tax=Culex pipiens TaxID=7175 RepID=A0A8D8AAL3_CULPI